MHTSDQEWYVGPTFKMKRYRWLVFVFLTLYFIGDFTLIVILRSYGQDKLDVSVLGITMFGALAVYHLMSISPGPKKRWLYKRYLRIFHEAGIMSVFAVNVALFLDSEAIHFARVAILIVLAIALFVLYFKFGRVKISLVGNGINLFSKIIYILTLIYEVAVFTVLLLLFA